MKNDFNLDFIFFFDLFHIYPISPRKNSDVNTILEVSGNTTTLFVFVTGFITSPISDVGCVVNINATILHIINSNIRL